MSRVRISSAAPNINQTEEALVEMRGLFRERRSIDTTWEAQPIISWRLPALVLTERYKPIDRLKCTTPVLRHDRRGICAEKLFGDPFLSEKPVLEARPFRFVYGHVSGDAILEIRKYVRVVYTA